MIRGRTCADGGLLVKATARLASDPCEYFHPAVTSVGCNRLRCSHCGQWVRSEPGLSLKQDVATDVAALYASAAWRGLPFVAAQDEFRLYACRCSAWVETYLHEIENDHESPTDPNVPWACQGHPAPQLPLTLGALTIAADADWAEIVAAILGGACPRPLEREKTNQLEGPGNWLAWLHAYLADLPVAEQLSPAIAERADDADPAVVGRVFFFFSTFPRAAGIERLLARAEKDPRSAAVGFVIPEYYDPLTAWDVLIARLEQRGKECDGLDQRAFAALREVLLVPLHGRTDVVANALERASSAFNDVELRVWIADHIVQIDAAAPGRWRLLMRRLADWYAKPQTGHLILIAGMRLLESGAVTVDEFRDWMDNDLAHGWRDDAWIKPLESMLGRR